MAASPQSTATVNDLAVSMQSVRMQFGANVVLDGVTLDVRDQEILAVMGSSGGGKTTLLRCIAGLIKPTGGSVSVKGIDVSRDPFHAREKLGMVFQSSALFDYLTVEQNLLFGVKRHLKLSQKEQVTLCSELLETVGLKGTERLFPSELSGGMRKRLGIARALALKPDVILYDEPTTGLDPVTTYSIDRMVVAVRDSRRVASIVVSHDVGSVMRVADRVAFLHAGQLAFLGDPQLFAKSDHPVIREMLDRAFALSLDSDKPR